MELNQNTEKIKNLRAENKHLQSLLSALNTYKTGSGAPPLLIQHFQSELNYLSDLINKRAASLSQIETNVKANRIIPNSNPPPQGEKAKFLYENEQLIDLAIRQEQVSIIEHSKLQLSHDLRKLYKFKRYVQDIIDQNNIDFKRDEEEVKNKKKRIENLRKAIEYEKSRINSMQTPQYEINEAAKLIQKHWRGYYQRQHLIKYNGKIMVEYEEETDEDESEDSNENSSDDYFDNSNENEDLIGVFNVTGVANTQEDNQYDDKNIHAPADAFNNHKNQSKNMSKSNEILRPNSEKRFNMTRNDEKPKPINTQMVEQTKKETKNKNLDGRNKIKQSQPNQRKIKSNANPNPKYIRKSKTQTIVSPRLENLNQSSNNNTNSPINIKTYMCE